MRYLTSLLWWFFLWYSLAMSFAFLSPGFPGTAFLATNYVPDIFRKLLWNLLLKALGAGLISFAGIFLWRRLRGFQFEETLERFQSWLYFIRPLSLVWIFCGLLNPFWWKSRTIFCYGIAITCGIACSRWLFPKIEKHLESEIPSSISTTYDWLFLSCLFAVFSAYTAIGVINYHYALGTRDYDLGIVENFLYNTINGNWFESPLEGKNHFAIHVSYLYFFILPFYAMIPKTETLLVIQSLVLGGAVFPLYLAIRSLTRNRFLGLFLAFIWVIHPSVGGAAFWDFHELKFFPVIFFFGFWAYWESHWKLFGLFIFLFLGIKEDSGLFLILWSFIAFREGRKKGGWVLLSTGVISYIIMAKGVIPWFGGSTQEFSKYFAELIPTGKGPDGIIETLLLNPLYAFGKFATERKVLFLIQVFSPLAFACFITVEGRILTLFGVGLSLLATWYPLFELGFQYIMQGLAPGFIGFGYAWRRWSETVRKRVFLVTLILSGLTCYHYGMYYPAQNFKAGFEIVNFDYESKRPEYEELRYLIGKIPEQASVTASMNAIPHMARRRFIYALRLTGHKPSILFLAPEKKLPGTDSEYFLIHRQDIKSNLLKDVVPEAAARDGYREVASGTYYLLLQKAPSP